MSRSGYSEMDDWDRDSVLSFGRYRGSVASAIRGKRGQTMLRDLLAALDAMPVKELIAESLSTHDGEVCTLGALGKARGIDLDKIDDEDYESVAAAFNVAEPLVRDVVYANDECGSLHETDAQRWERMRRWVARHIIEPKAP